MEFLVTLKKFTVYKINSNTLYFEGIEQDNGFRLYFDYELPCYPVNHEGFNNLRYCTKVEIQDYDLIFDLDPHMESVKEFFFNPDVEILTV